MGAGSSKPDASAGTRHVFASETPVQFSSNLIEALQSSSETDSSRAKSLELHIQTRVAEELERLRQREHQTLEEIEKRLAVGSIPSAAALSTTSSASYHSPTTPGSLDLDAPRIPFAGREFDPPSPATEAAPPTARPTDTIPVATVPTIEYDPSRQSVLKEIERIRTKFESRKRLVELDETVELAKTEVTSCLRKNDRRPLDCWKEVEMFKQEVSRLERSFVDKVVG